MNKKVLGVEAREVFYEQIAANQLSLAEALKAMRAITGMTQPEYAKFVGVAARIIIDLERGVGNPTLSSLKKIVRPFRMGVGFVLINQQAPFFKINGEPNAKSLRKTYPT